MLEFSSLCFPISTHSFGRHWVAFYQNFCFKKHSPFLPPSEGTKCLSYNCFFFRKNAIDNERLTISRSSAPTARRDDRARMTPLADRASFPKTQGIVAGPRDDSSPPDYTEDERANCIDNAWKLVDWYPVWRWEWSKWKIWRSALLHLVRLDLPWWLPRFPSYFNAMRNDAGYETRSHRFNLIQSVRIRM